MENEKKPQRFAVRFSALFVAVLLLVALAVPAFAEAGTYPSNIPPIPAEGNFVLVNMGSWRLISVEPGMYIKKTSPEGDYWYICDSTGTSVAVHYYKLTDGAWVDSGTSKPAMDFNDYDGQSLPAKLRWTNLDLRFESDRIVFVEPPPPPDLKADVTSGLTVVMDWVGTTVNALFTGELSGLLPIVALFVAIPVVFITIRLIKRTIWGA